MLFKEDIGKYAGELRDKGYILLKDVLSDGFLKYLKDFHRRSMTGEVAEIGTWRIAGKKQQYVFPFPSIEAAIEFRDALSRLTGLKKDTLTISERHLKQYETDARPYPAPHKDRSASKFSVGLPVFLGPETSVCVFPTLDRTDNTADTAIFMTKEERPDLDTIYDSKDALLLNEGIGDMIVFHGSSMFHERVKPAGTAVLYIKMNDDGRDPLGENIYGATPAQNPLSAMAEAC
jgi:hypothetical protein